MILNVEKINLVFEKIAHHILKLRWIYLSLFVLSIVACLYGASMVKIDTSNENSFLDGDSINIQTDHFKEIFGNDQYVAVLLTSNDLFSHESLSLLRELHRELKDSVPFVEKVTSINDIEFTIGNDYGMAIQQIVPDRIPHDHQALETIKEKAYRKENFRKRLLSSDTTQTLLTIKLLPFPDHWQDKYQTSPDELVGESVVHIINQTKYEPFSPRAVGMPVISYEKRHYFSGESARIMGIALVLAIVILIFSLRSAWGVVVPIVSAIGSMIILYGVIGFLGTEVDNMVLSFPFLIGFAIAIAYSIHLFIW